MKILFAASEAFPFIKTGGLGDVVHSLPIALNSLGHDVRLVLPAYRDVLASVDSKIEIAEITLPGMDNTHKVKIIQAHKDELGDYLYLVDVPALFDRPGNPYVHKDGDSWPDNAERFTVFSRAVAEFAAGISGLDWKPDVVHCHDWQTGLVPAFISLQPSRPKTVFTIHNLAYDGVYSHADFISLGMPADWWSVDGVEFYGHFSMLKAAMVFSDQVTTVSPNYAREICTHEYGYRYEGILNNLGNRLTGIINGIDLDVWNPETDVHIAKHYSAAKNRSAAKKANKLALLGSTGLTAVDAPLLGFIGRMVEQKGVDLITAIVPKLFQETNANIIILGSGDPGYESKLTELSKQYPQRLHVHIGYSEALAHQIEAGCDIFLMPSRFEPCGLNQMYSLHYGTPPVVNKTGGLADTVVDTNKETLANKTATGFVFSYADDGALYDAITRALEMYGKPRLWAQICKAGMEEDLGWQSSAEQYQNLYQM